MFENIDSILRVQCGLKKDRPVIAGVSGGPDSLCLMHILRSTGYRVIVAHYNHKLRPDSDADANTVEQAASRLNFVSVIESGNVREFAETEKLSIEEAARILRYRFLMAQARRFEAQAVAVGHTADDQVETVLMHFIRGAGLAGLKGMTHRTIIQIFDQEIPVVRPLLDVWREETIVYCAANGLRPRFDPSNDSLDFFRNRLRNLLIPTIESYNPRFREAVWRTATALAGDHEILADVLDDAWKGSIIQQTSDFVSFDASALEKHPLGLQRYLIRRAMESIHPDNLDISFATLERAAGFINDPEKHPRIDLTSGLHMLREGMLIYVAADRTDLPVERWPQIPDESSTIPLKIPGQIPLSGGWRLTCERWNIASLAMEQARSNNDPFQVWLDARGISDALELRVRQDGDRFEPLGMDGHEMKISDFFINVKLPKRARDRWPLLCMGSRVLWVPGYRPAHSVRLTENTRQALYFSLTRS
ncbi:MAG: tRNA lysidine(34) synthetase TilS [Anaerolineales bacterium]|nr:tRNA lysidine(34) synthetase TilS [Anaerolineae bacterium]PWB75074.1 MAG: tRNA lysidine(34) synthetase TilS [Anaerolineales bacterium]